MMIINKIVQVDKRIYSFTYLESSIIEENIVLNDQDKLFSKLKSRDSLDVYFEEHNNNDDDDDNKQNCLSR